MTGRTRARLAGCAVAAGWLAVAVAAPVPQSELRRALNVTLKGHASLTPAPEVQSQALGLIPGESTATALTCRTPAAALPLLLGSRDQFAKLGGAAQGAALGLLGRVLSAATGGKVDGLAPGAAKQATAPPVYQDPIERKQHRDVKDKASGIRLNLGGRLASDGLLLSTRIESTRGEGTFHEIYLERDDCRRIFPSADYTYEVWGHWNLSVSWTRTSSSYQDGKLVDQQQSSGGFVRSGDWSSLPGMQGAVEAVMKEVPKELQGGFVDYQRAVAELIGTPLWQRLGFRAPVSGARAVGSTFRLGETDLTALRAGRYRAIVIVTREHGPFYEALSVPVAVASGPGDGLLFDAVAPAAPH